VCVCVCVCVSMFLRGELGAGSWPGKTGNGRIESVLGGRRSSELGLEEEMTGKQLASRRSEDHDRRVATRGEKAA
jgi:hypothetical protein